MSFSLAFHLKTRMKKGRHATLGLLAGSFLGAVTVTPLHATDSKDVDQTHPEQRSALMQSTVSLPDDMIREISRYMDDRTLGMACTLNRSLTRPLFKILTHTRRLWHTPHLRSGFAFASGLPQGHMAFCVSVPEQRNILMAQIDRAKSLNLKLHVALNSRSTEFVGPQPDDGHEVLLEHLNGVKSLVLSTISQNLFHDLAHCSHALELRAITVDTSVYDRHKKLRSCGAIIENPIKADWLSHFKLVKHLDLDMSCFDSAKQTLQIIGHHCPSLITLQMSRIAFNTIEPNGIQALSRLSNLMALELHGGSFGFLYPKNSSLSREDMTVLAKGCTRLKELNLSSFIIEEEALRGFLTNASQLEEFHANHSKAISGKILADLVSLPHLRKLSIANTGITSQDLVTLASSALNLRMLNLSYCKNGFLDGLAALSQLTNLSWLGVSNTKISTQDLLAIAKTTPHMTFLDVSGCKDITDAGFKAFKSWTCLNELNLQFSNIGKNAALSLHASSNSLRKLTLSGTIKVNEAFFQSLPVLPEIREIAIVSFSASNHSSPNYSSARPNLSPTAIAGIVKNAPNLESLSLSGIKTIDANFLSVLSKARNLKSLNLEMTNIRNEGLDIIVKSLTTLEHLNLDQCADLTSAGIRQLVHMPHLRSVSLLSTDTSEKMWEELTTKSRSLKYCFYSNWNKRDIFIPPIPKH